jgi:hypothetical protein
LQHVRKYPKGAAERQFGFCRRHRCVVELHETLTELARITGPAGADLVNDAIRSATVVTDAVQDMAADMAVSA